MYSSLLLYFLSHYPHSLSNFLESFTGHYFLQYTYLSDTSYLLQNTFKLQIIPISSNNEDLLRLHHCSPYTWLHRRPSILYKRQRPVHLLNDVRCKQSRQQLQRSYQPPLQHNSRHRSALRNLPRLLVRRKRTNQRRMPRTTTTQQCNLHIATRLHQRSELAATDSIPNS